MRLAVDRTRVCFDGDGAKLRPAAPGSRRCRPSCSSSGPGADRSNYEDILGPRLAGIAQVVYVDPRGRAAAATGRTRRSALAGATDPAEGLPLLEFPRYPDVGRGVLCDRPEVLDDVVEFILRPDRP
jgi:hypothetical protein